MSSLMIRHLALALTCKLAKRSNSRKEKTFISVLPAEGSLRLPTPEIQWVLVNTIHRRGNLNSLLEALRSVKLLLAH